MTNAQKFAIVSPVAGLLIWCTDCTTTGTWQVYNGTAWTNMDGTYNCGAYIAPGVWKQFMCHNLGADISLDPNNPDQRIIGNYYQWGRKDPVANAFSPSIIGSWNTTSASDNSWGTNDGDNFKNLINDPCPFGFRIPTITEWAAVIQYTNNTWSNLGTWSANEPFSGSSNFSAAKTLGPIGITTKTLTLPTAGYYTTFDNLVDGKLVYRAWDAGYWSSTENSLDGLGIFDLYFNPNDQVIGGSGRAVGRSVRCIAQ